MSKSNALRNSFIPKRSPIVISRILQRLTTDSLINICLLWCSMPLTQPRPSLEILQELETDLDQYIQDFKNLLQSYKDKTKNTNKRRIIDKLLVDIYPNGLNLLQYAQIDSQLIVEKSQGFLWQVSQLVNSKDESHVLNLHDPQLIQLFDLLHTSTTSNSINNSLVSRKPFLISLPHNSSNIIHSPITNDQTSSIILQSISFALSSPTKQLRIISNPSSTLLKSLESLHIIHGNSRFSSSLGIWTPYADGAIDISPFDDPETHQTLQKEETPMDLDEKRCKVAQLRFKGSLVGLQSDVLYEDNKPFKKRKVNEELRNIDKNEYSSITPIQTAQFELISDFNNERPRLKLRFNGNDVS
ncbi:unnamed protein product [Wickerhamomyces anomalus]